MIKKGYGALISECGTYRYGLWRAWTDDPDDTRVTWIMLNPSTADANTDDATIRRCMGFARSWGAGSINVLNLFALRSTDPRALYDHPDPVGPGNAAYIREVCSRVSVVVAAWGSQPRIRAAVDRQVEVIKDILREHVVFCLGQCADGNPKHPVRLAGDTKLEAMWW